MKGKPITVEAADKIRKMYFSSGLTKREVAERTGTSNAVVSRYTTMDDDEFARWKDNRRTTGDEAEDSALEEEDEAEKATKEVAREAKEALAKAVYEARGEGVCPRCGRYRFVRGASFCWNCGLDLRNEYNRCAGALKDMLDNLPNNVLTEAQQELIMKAVTLLEKHMYDTDEED